MPLVKKLVYGYALDEVLKNATISDMPENFITQYDLNSAPNLQTFLNDVIQLVRNRMPHFPLSREVTKNPFTVLAMMNHIHQFYEQANIQLQQHVQPQQLPEHLAQPIQIEQPLEQLPAQAVQLVCPQEQTWWSQQPRLFSLLSNLKKLVIAF
ncbi:hypothetical protein BCV72DRAFT_317339 [Rhizopus microsporus var. microsporus]|uniref:Uncharacterized protein n=2 Tax=Rhizopus microsporus TaxID=58291 RepID=A0A2G4T8I0_RHIZD|nr:uncharacterized protein RHIMIDRAFT_243408 [Rhizopus microsporus ATCC 52813]ORE09843.1 hypothetical protein BCV72DRAFT_317339 [Rhizopus microsporus var. microsporus]PHZ17323.1 hypothetical protein RHIMIDRAFT_243408 [Rhizopus microsporus ATCC 52813]